MMETPTYTLNGNPNAIKERKAKIEEVRQQLKQEFFGLDGVIDQVTDQMSSWYCLPGLQVKPVIINLWGMTGTGKSSLVNRLTALLGFKDAHYRYDMGEIANSPGKMNIHNQLTDTEYREPGAPFVISLDEFQHARSLNENGMEKIKPEERIVWQLLDDGTFEVDEASSKFLNKLSNICHMLKEALNCGVSAEDGRVVENQETWRNIINTYVYYSGMIFFQNEMKEFDDETKEAFPKLIPDAMVWTIYESNPNMFGGLTLLKDNVASFNLRQTLDFFLDVKRKAMQPTTVDCTQALIFVIGNLDEAYTMHQTNNPDLDADHLHQKAQKISIMDIKGALKKRFRSEEIARLGNNHIIYPALRKQDFKNIIRKELNRVREQLQQKTGLPLTVDESFEALLFREGVYPAQGSRPVFTTIHHLVYPLVTDVLMQYSGSVEAVESVCLYHEPPQIKARIDRSNGSKVQEPEIISREQPLMLNTMRESKKDDQQAIIAVHESGHAIGAIFLQSLMPELICSVSADRGMPGFTQVDQEHRYISRKGLKNRIAAKLGGYSAELQVFGEENLTSGSVNDISKVTEMLTQMLRECGMGPMPALFCKNGPNLNHSVQDEGEIDHEVRRWIREALDTIQTTLHEQEVLLYAMAGYLSDHPRMDKGLIVDFCQKYGKGFDPGMFKGNGESGFYRRMVQGRE